MLVLGATAVAVIKGLENAAVLLLLPLRCQLMGVRYLPNLRMEVDDIFAIG
jgi:hypothetical protein